MPTYSYVCISCSQGQEVHQKFSDGPVLRWFTCAQCGGEMQKQIYVPSIIYRGNGFYVTDNRVTKESKQDV